VVESSSTDQWYALFSRKKELRESLCYGPQGMWWWDLWRLFNGNDYLELSLLKAVSECDHFFWLSLLLGVTLWSHHCWKGLLWLIEKLSMVCSVRASVAERHLTKVEVQNNVMLSFPLCSALLKHYFVNLHDSSLSQVFHLNFIEVNWHEGSLGNLTKIMQYSVLWSCDLNLDQKPKLKLFSFCFLLVFSLYCHPAESHA
jgi:hypothetical protein